MSSVILFLFGFATAFGAQNALRGPGRTLPWWARPMWLPAMLTSELLPLRFVMGLLIAAATIGFGALDRLSGVVGLALLMAGWIGYLVLSVRARRGVVEVARRLAIDPPEPAPERLTTRLARYPYSVPGDIERIDDIQYSDTCTLDLYRGPLTDGARILIQVHGGGWTGGNKRQQARPLLHHLARNGWACLSIAYPLSADASFESRVAAVRRAVEWVHTDGAEHDLDPTFVALTGGSAGGHLASLVALQDSNGSGPGAVDACVPVYGIYDFANRNATRDNWPVIPRVLMQGTPDEAPQRYRAASPLDQVHAAAPPFLVVHGTHDSLVPPAEARQFVDALEAVSTSEVVYLELPGATHSFDIVPSPRTRIMVSAVERFLERAIVRLDT